MLRFELACDLLTDLVITSALKAAAALKFRSSILPTLEVVFGLVSERNLSNFLPDQDGNTKIFQFGPKFGSEP